MSNIPETIEANQFLGKVTNAVVEIAPDGVEISEILSKLGILLEAPDAAKGMGEYFTEQGRATIEDQEQRKAAFGDQLKSLSERSAYNVSNFTHGIQCAIAEIAEKTADKIAEKVGRDGLPTRTMSDEPMTGLELLAYAAEQF